jgi:uncharacterized membrane protein YkvA (DUF1232 family)
MAEGRDSGICIPTLSMKTCGIVALVLIICITVLAALFLVLLAMPNSRLRSVFMEALGWLAVILASILVISPVDIVPDVFVGLGQIDDIAYVIGGLLSGIAAYRQHRSRNLMDTTRVIDVEHHDADR